MSEPRAWHVTSSDGIVTEETEASIRDKIISGSILRHFWVWSEGMTDWKQIDEIPVFAVAFDSVENKTSAPLIRLGNVPSAGYGPNPNWIGPANPSTIIRRETRHRGFFGHLFKWLFIIFNCIMVLWLLAYWNDLGHMFGGATSDAERVGGAIGGTIGTFFLVFFWLAGAVILGLLTLFTRGKKIVIEQAVSSEDLKKKYRQIR